MRAFLFGCIAFLLTSDAAAQSVRIQVIDRGQADGILIRTPNEEWVVIDAGTNRDQATAMRDVWGVDRVALAIVSHRHNDHMGGMDEVLRDLPVDRYLGIMEDCPGRAFDDRVRQVIADRSIPVEPLDQDTITIDEVRFIVLPLPPRSECPDEENNNSVVVRMEFGEFSMLFPGDAEEDQLEWLVINHRDLLDADVLKASHHGSDNGTTDNWLNAVTPQRVVISAGVDERYRHPHYGAVGNYVAATGDVDRVSCTNRHQTVRVYGYADGVVRVFRDHPTDKSCVYDGTHY